MRTLSIVRCFLTALLTTVLVAGLAGEALAQTSLPDITGR